MTTPVPTHRQATGGAFEHRGQFFLRVRIAPGKRQAAALPWCSSLDVALDRARVVQNLVNRLRESGHTAIVPKVVELSLIHISEPTRPY